MKLNKLKNTTDKDFYQVNNLVISCKFPDWPSTIVKYMEHFCISGKLYTINEYVEVII